MYCHLHYNTYYIPLFIAIHYLSPLVEIYIILSFSSQNLYIYLFKISLQYILYSTFTVSHYIFHFSLKYLLYLTFFTVAFFPISYFTFGLLEAKPIYHPFIFSILYLFWFYGMLWRRRGGGGAFWNKHKRSGWNKKTLTEENSPPYFLFSWISTRRHNLFIFPKFLTKEWTFAKYD